MKADALVDTLAEVLADAKDKTLVDTLADTVAQLQAGTRDRETMLRGGQSTGGNVAQKGGTAQKVLLPDT